MSTKREAVISWWNDMTKDEQSQFCGRRNPNSLTGKEIEKIYQFHKDVLTDETNFNSKKNRFKSNERQSKSKLREMYLQDY
jgi:hypothetical protein